MFSLGPDGGKDRMEAAAQRTADGTLRLAGLYRSRGRLEEAAALYSREILLRRRPREAALGRLAVRWQQGRMEEAFEEAERFLSLGVDSERQIESLSFPLGEEPLPKSTQKVLLPLLPRLETSSAGPWPLFYRIAFGWILGRPAGPAAYERLAAQARGRYAWMRWLAGKREMERKRWNEAAAHLAAAVRCQPRFMRAGFLLGESLLFQGRTAEAVKVFEGFKPAEASSLGRWLSWLGEIHLRLGDDQKAIGYLDEACRRGDGSPRAFCWRGAVWLHRGELERAAADFTESIRLDPADEEPYLWRALAFERLGRPIRAKADLAAALRRRPGHPAALAFRARLLGRAGDASGMRRDAGGLPASVLDAAEVGRLSDARLLLRLDELIEREAERLVASPNFYAAKDRRVWRESRCAP
jgi:tetratricopeptide (TPR) repeat protein